MPASRSSAAPSAPKNGKYLCIPLPAALDSSGLPLKSSPRDWPNTFCAKSKAGNLLIFQRRGTSIRAALRAEDVGHHPAAPEAWAKTLRAGIPYFVERAMDAMVREVMKQ